MSQSYYEKASPSLVRKVVDVEDLDHFANCVENNDPNSGEYDEYGNDHKSEENTIIEDNRSNSVFDNLYGSRSHMSTIPERFTE